MSPLTLRPLAKVAAENWIASAALKGLDVLAGDLMSAALITVFLVKVKTFGVLWR